MEDSVSPRLWTSSFVLLTFSNLALASGAFLLFPTLPIYAEDILAADNIQKGLIVSLFSITALFIRPFAGIALDGWGRKIVYLIGIFFFVACMPLYFLSSTILILLSIRLLHGFPWGIVTTSGNTIVSDIVPPAKRGEGIGYFGMSFTVSMALGPIVGLWILTNYDYNTLFYVATGMVTGAVLVAGFIRYPQMSLKKPKGLTWDMIAEKRSIPSSLMALICSMVYSALITFMSSFTKEINLPPIQLSTESTIEGSSLFFLFYAIGLTLVRPIAGKIMDKNGPKWVLIGGFLFLILGLILLAFSKSLPLFIAASMISGVGMGTILPTTITMVVNLVEPSRRGVANSTFFSAVDIGVAFGSVVFGAIADISSLQTMYLIGAGTIVFPLLYFYFFVLGDYERKMKDLSF